MQCEYGCGQEAKFQLKCGKWCCSKSQNSCLAVRNKNSKNRTLQNAKAKKECPICHKFITLIGNCYDLHVNKCKKLNKNKSFAFINVKNKYNNWYNNIIINRINNPLINKYGERHHIIPKSLGGSDSANNIVKLTPKEHYICHLLLIKIYSNDLDKKRKMCSAYFRLSSKDKDFVCANTYERIKKEYSELIKGKDLSHRKGKIWIKSNNISKIISKDQLNYFLSKGWQKGRIVRLNKFFSKNKECAHINKDGKSKMIFLDELYSYLDKGWKVGKTNYEKRWKLEKNGYIIFCGSTHCRKLWESRGWKSNFKEKIHSNVIKNKINIHNCKLMNFNGIQKFIETEKIEEYLNLGWKIGGIPGLKKGIKKSYRTKEHCLKISKSNIGKH